MTLSRKIYLLHIFPPGILLLLPTYLICDEHIIFQSNEEALRKKDLRAYIVKEMALCVKFLI